MDQAHYVENSAFHKDLGRYVSFPSRSDAMIASLALSHKLDCALMDIIFLIISDRSFNPSEMTLRKTEDIYTHLFKRSFAEASIGGSTPEIYSRKIKSPTTRPPTARTPIPPVILDSVITWIDESIEDRDFEPGVLKHILRNLAFVQRRYTRPVHRILGRKLRLEQCGRENLLKRCFANPLAGPWTRKARFSISGDAALATNTLNVALTERITGLRNFTLLLNNSLLSTGLLENTFALLGSVSELVLGFRRSSTDKRVSASHYRSIISMPSLKTLVLQNWDIPSMLDVPCEGLPPWFAPLKPSPSFRMLHLYRPCFRFQNSRSKGVDLHLFWTRDPHDNFFLGTLVVHFPRNMKIEELDDVCGCLLPLLHRLEVLYVAGLQRDQEEHLLQFLSRTSKALRRLFFQSVNCPSEATLRSVPQAIRKLSLHFGDCQVCESLNQWEDVDARLHGLISSGIWPELNTLNIYFSYEHTNKKRLVIPQQFVRLSKTKALCKDRDIGVNLTMLRDYANLYYKEYQNGVLEELNTMNSMNVFIN